MKQYRTINNIVGWVIFAIAAIVYCMTIEPTASFWDCPEFITTGYKLEVGHPPGAPFFMLVANLFSQFASDTTQVAKMVNYMSALMSAGCILFLFWTITHLVRKLVISDEETFTTSQIITIMGSGAVGALVYTFSDTFWFSAVEGEVYAFSSLFTAVVFWLILKWEDVADQPHSDRWLILIAYLTGLSIGVHLLNLLCLPAIVLVYYYKRVPNATAKGSLLALFASAVLVAVVLYGIVPGIVKVGGWFELLFVNDLGMSFNTGVIVYILVASAAIIWAVYESFVEKSENRMMWSFLLTVGLLGIPFYGHGTTSIIIGVIVLGLLWLYLRPATQRSISPNWKISARTLNTTMLSIMMIVIGYSSYALIVIRSTANTPMDQNSPEDIFTLGEYLGREQYGTRPLFYGPTFASKVEFQEKNGYCEPVIAEEQMKWIRKEKNNENEPDSYIQVEGRIEYKYAQNMLFPRMYSSSMNHPQLYKAWMNIKGHDVPYNQCGEMQMVNIPTMWENIQFFFSYQVNWMYWRYFMWNFVGRQNDLQGNGELEHGNWISGISWLDNLMLGNQELLPDELKENKGHNVYYALPLLLGLIGLLWQAYKGQKGIQQFWVVFFLFFMTGLAIVLYLNQTPGQPRERDYAYAGSFYAFAIWVGMGVAGLIHLLHDLFTKPEESVNGQPNNPLLASIVSVICLLVPIQMASQTWDDHDRSGRYMTRDFGQNYLMTLQETGDPIIYTNGDNDTFPLWYNQETEGFRTDARTCNLSYLQTDWYIDQMKRPSYESPSLPITWDRTEYVEGTNEYVVIQPEYKKSIDELYATARKEALNGNAESLVNVEREFGDNPYELKNILKYWVRGKHSDLHVIPTDSIVLKVDKEAVRRSGMLIPGDSIPDYMHISLKGQRALYKKDLMKLEMLAEANWERPIFIAVSVGSDEHMGLSDYFMLEGLAYRFTPFNSKQTGVSIDSEKMFDNLMHKFKFGGIDKPGIYIDENASRMCYTHRRMFSMLVEQLMKEGKHDKALEVIKRCFEVLPVDKVRLTYYDSKLIDALFECNYPQAREIATDVFNTAYNDLLYYGKLPAPFYAANDSKRQMCMVNAQWIIETLQTYKQTDLYNELNEVFGQMYSIYSGAMTPTAVRTLDRR